MRQFGGGLTYSGTMADGSDERKSIHVIFNEVIDNGFTGMDSHFATLLDDNIEVLQIRDESGKTLLVHGIIKHITPQKMAAMLERAKELAKLPFRGQLPLHIILEEPLNAKDVEVVDLLYDAYPKAGSVLDEYGTLIGYPLHKALQKAPFLKGLEGLVIKLLEAFPFVSEIHCEGSLPLHLALDVSKPPTIVTEILRIFKGAASQPTKEGVLPLHLAVQKKLDRKVIQDLIQAYPSALKQCLNGQRILEYAIKMKSAQDVTHALLHCDTLDIKAQACSRAAIFNIVSRPQHKPVLSNRAQLHSSQDSAGHTDPSQRRMWFYVQDTVGGDKHEIILRREAVVEDLAEEVYHLMGIPADMQYLEYDGRRIKSGERLAEVIKDTRSVIRASYENSLVHLGLRNEMSVDDVLYLLAVRKEFAQEVDERGFFPLHVALEHRANDEKVLIHLIEAYEQAVYERCGELLPLQVAIEKEAPEAILEKMINMPKKTRHSAVWTPDGHYYPRGLSEVGTSGTPLLCSAIRWKCSANVVRMLLYSKCPINFRDLTCGATPLELALRYDCADDVFELLLEATKQDRHFHNQTPTGQNVLHVACGCKATSASRIESLLQGGEGALLQRDIEGKLPIHIAAASGVEFDAIKLLATRSPKSVHERDSHNRNALQIAILSHPPEGVVCELCRFMPDLHLVLDEQGRSVLNVAVIVDAPLYVIKELLEWCPLLLSDVNLLNKKWPTTKAGKEVRRLAVSSKSPLEAAIAAAATDAEDYSSVRIKALQMSSAVEDRNVVAPEAGSPQPQPDEDWYHWFGFHKVQEVLGG